MWLLLSILTFLAGLGIIVIILTVGLYILFAYSLYRLAMNNGYRDIAFLSFIPFVNIYLLVQMSGDIVIFDGIIFKSNIVGIVMIVFTLLPEIAYLGLVVKILMFLLWEGVLYNLYKKLDSSFPLLYAILSVIFLPIFLPIYLFIKKDEIFEDVIVY